MYLISMNCYIAELHVREYDSSSLLIVRDSTIISILLTERPAVRLFLANCLEMHLLARSAQTPQSVNGL